MFVGVIPNSWLCQVRFVVSCEQTRVLDHCIVSARKRVAITLTKELRNAVRILCCFHHRYMKTLPRDVQLCYEFVLFEKKCGATWSLLDRVMNPSQAMTALARDIQQVGHT